MANWKLILVGAVLILTTNIFASGTDDKESSFAIAKDGCGLADGYVCVGEVEDDFLSAASQERMITGNYLKAWQVAYTDFEQLSELELEQKNLKHYKIGFTENDTHYVVLFQALLLPSMIDGEPVGLMTGTFGKTIRYWIDKQSMTVDKHLFYK